MLLNFIPWSNENITLPNIYGTKDKPWVFQNKLNPHQTDKFKNFYSV